jgi:heme ABC exporter ATP-binding subunit CcmA
MEPVVQLRGAVTLLGRFPALAGIDLEVAAGEVVHLRGPNGAGKTTLLRCCAGLTPLARGEGRVLGHDIADRRQAVALRRRIGLLGHESGLYAELTVAENVRFWGRAAGAAAADVDAALDACGLSGRLESVPVARLSAGQRRRTSFACLVARRPELWLLDEPHAGLDQPGRDVVDRLVRQARDSGATILFASHELDRAESIADRSVVVTGGSTPDAPATVASNEEPVLVP